MTDSSIRGCLRVWRENAGLSQAKLASLLGLKQPAVAQWEAGGRPDLAKALELQALTQGHVLAVSWGYTDEQIERVLRAAQFPTAADGAADIEDETIPAEPVLVTDGYSQVLAAARG